MATKKLIMDEALRVKLRGLLPITTSATETYTPKEFSELPEGDRPVFTLAPLDGEAQAALDNTSEPGNRSLTALKYGLKAIKWDSFPEFTGEMDDEKIKLIPSALRWLIAGRIWQITNLTDDERLGLNSSPDSTLAP